MAKITVNGDALTIATNITVEQYDKVMNSIEWHTHLVQRVNVQSTALP